MSWATTQREGVVWLAGPADPQAFLGEEQVDSLGAGADEKSGNKQKKQGDAANLIFVRVGGVDVVLRGGSANGNRVATA